MNDACNAVDCDICSQSWLVLSLYAQFAANETNQARICITNSPILFLCHFMYACGLCVQWHGTPQNNKNIVAAVILINP